jgi:GNAT superfamily N-acetyltransferase
MDAVVIDSAQHKGLGTELYRLLIRIARDEKLKMVISNMLPENREMRAMCVRYGFEMFSNSEDNMIRAELELEGSTDLSHQVVRNRIQTAESAA